MEPAIIHINLCPFLTQLVCCIECGVGGKRNIRFARYHDFYFNTSLQSPFYGFFNAWNGSEIRVHYLYFILCGINGLDISLPHQFGLFFRNTVYNSYILISLESRIVS